eukprot:7379463-Prymnesium_polylepis.1
MRTKARGSSPSAAETLLPLVSLSETPPSLSISRSEPQTMSRCAWLKSPVAASCGGYTASTIAWPLGASASRSAFLPNVTSYVPPGSTTTPIALTTPQK